MYRWSVIVIVSLLSEDAELEDALAFDEVELVEDDEHPPNTGTIVAINSAHIIFLIFFICKFPFLLYKCYALSLLHIIADYHSVL